MEHKTTGPMIVGYEITCMDCDFDVSGLDETTMVRKMALKHFKKNGHRVSYRIIHEYIIEKKEQED